MQPVKEKDLDGEGLGEHDPQGEGVCDRKPRKMERTHYSHGSKYYVRIQHEEEEDPNFMVFLNKLSDNGFYNSIVMLTRTICLGVVSTGPMMFNLVFTEEILKLYSLKRGTYPDRIRETLACHTGGKYAYPEF